MFPTRQMTKLKWDDETQEKVNDEMFEEYRFSYGIQLYVCACSVWTFFFIKIYDCLRLLTLDCWSSASPIFKIIKSLEEPPNHITFLGINK